MGEDSPDTLWLCSPSPSLPNTGTAQIDALTTLPLLDASDDIKL